MDEIFEHLLQDTDRGISINQIVNRIVFPNHDICMQAKAALERDYGEFCFAAVIPDYEDFQHMDPTDATNAALETCGSDGEEVTNVVWGYNSLQYEYNGIPSLEVAKAISKMIGVPVYYEYTDADELATGAVIADAQGDSVSFANVVDKSCWVYFPEGFDGATDTLFRCGMGTMSMPDGSQKYFEDTTDPIMRSYAQRGNVSLYFDFLKDQFGAQEEPQPAPSRKKSSSAASKRKKKSTKTQKVATATMDASDVDVLFSHLIEETGGQIQPQRVINRIVFPGHNACMQVKKTLEQELGGFSLATLIPAISDLGDLSQPQNAAMCIHICGALGGRTFNEMWGYNSLQYEYDGIPLLRAAKALAGLLGAPVYYEYVVTDGYKAGAWLADPDDDDVSFAASLTKSQWTFFPDNSQYRDATAVRCGVATVTLSVTQNGVPQDREVSFADTFNPIMQKLATRGTVSMYLDLINANYSSFADPSDDDDEDEDDEPQAESDAQASGNVYMSQAMGAMTFRIVFPNHDCCEYIRDDLEKCFGGFSLQAICGTPDGTFDSPDEVLSTMAGHGIPDDATDVEWGYNSVRYRVAHSVPNAIVLETLVQHYNIPLYVEYFDELKRATGAAITIPDMANPTAFIPGTLGCKEQMYFDRGSDNEGYVALRCGYCQAVSDDGKTRISFVDDPSQSVMAEMAEEASVGVYVRLLKKFDLEQVLPTGYQKPASRPAASPKKSTSTSSAEKSKISLWMNPIAEKHVWNSLDAYGQKRGKQNDMNMFFLEPLYRGGDQIRDPFGFATGRKPLPAYASHQAHRKVIDAALTTDIEVGALVAGLLGQDLLTSEELNALHRDIELKAQGISAIATGRGAALESRCDSVCYLIAKLRSHDGDNSQRFMMWMADTDQAVRVKFYGEAPAIGAPFTCRFSVVENDVITYWMPVEGEKGFSRYKQIPEGGRIDVSAAKSDSAAMSALRKANAMFLKTCGLKQTAPSKTRMTPEQSQRFSELREKLGRKTGYALTVLFSRCVLCSAEADRFLELMEHAAAAHDRGEMIDVDDTEVVEHKAVYMVGPISTEDGTCQLYNPNTVNFEDFRFQPNLLEDFHTDLPRAGSFINIATSVVESDVIAAWAGYNPGNAQRSARY